MTSSSDAQPDAPAAGPPPGPPPAPPSEDLLARAARRAPLVLALLALALLVPALGSYGLWEPHEVRIADAAKETMKSPGWALPARLAVRPPLPTWLVAIGYRFLGGGEWAGRLPIALASVLAVLACFWVGAGLFRRRAALLSALALLTMPVFFLGARQLTTAVLPILGTLLAVGGLARAAWPRGEGDPDGPADSSAARVVSLILAIAGLAIGHLTRGFGLGVAVPLVAVALPLVLVAPPDDAHGAAPDGGKLPRLARLVLPVLALASIALTFWAFFRHLPGAARAGYSAIVGGVPRASAHQVEFSSIFKQAGFGAFPWIALLPLAAARTFARLDGEQRPGRSDYGRLVIFVWIVAGYLADSLFAASVGDVAFGHYAALALAAGWLIDEAWADGAGAPVAGVIAGLGAAVIAHDYFMSPERWAGAHVLDAAGIKWPAPERVPPFVFLGSGLLWAVLAAAALAVPGSREPATSRLARLAAPFTRARLFAATLAVPLLTAAVGVYWVVPLVSKHLSYKSLFTKFEALSGKSKAPIGRFHVPGQLSEYGETTELVSAPAVLDFLAKSERAFVIASAEDLPAIDQAARARESAGGPPSYYVVDDTNSRFLLLSNQLDAKDKDRNPLRTSVVTELPKRPDHEVHIDFEGKIELVGYDLPAEVEGGRPFKIRMYYRVAGAIAGGYKVFIHFDGQGTRFNGDHVPLGGRFPTNYWAPGYYVIDEHTVENAKASAPAGQYQIYTGFWLGDQRLKVASGPHDGENRAKLGTVRVK